MLRSLLVKTAILIFVVAAAPLGWLSWRYYTGRPSYLLAKGRLALSGRNDAEVKRLARLLEEKGSPAAARLLRGWMWLRRGRAKLGERPTATDPVQIGQLAARMVAAAAAPSVQPAPAWQAGWDMATNIPIPSAGHHPGNEDFVKALDEFSRIQDDGRIGDEATVRAAECLFELGARRFAAEALTDLVERHPDVTEAHRWLAAVYIDLNVPDRALESLREWVRLDPEDGRPYRWIGFFARDERRYDDAVLAYRDALARKLEPTVQDEVRQELADTLAQYLHDYRSAIEVLDQGPEIFQSSAEVLTLRAGCLVNLAHTPEAVPLLERALRAEPHLEKALLLRGEIALQEDDAAAAIAPLKDAVSLDPYNVRIRQELMQAYQLLGKPDLAEQERVRGEASHKIEGQIGELYEQTRARPWDGDVRYRMALLCLEIQRRDQARTWLRAALACDPENAAARLTLAQLEARGPAASPVPLTESTP